jgi:hypothetical protein
MRKSRKVERKVERRLKDYTENLARQGNPKLFFRAPGSQNWHK